MRYGIGRNLDSFSSQDKGPSWEFSTVGNPRKDYSLGAETSYQPTPSGGAGAAAGAAGAAAGAMSLGPWAVAGAMALQVWQGAQQADMIREQSRLTQQLNEMNAQKAEVDAYEAEKFGYTQMGRYQSVIDNMVADQRVGMASANIDLSYGTAEQIQAETKLTGALNMLDIQGQARAKALGFKREARNIRLNGGMRASEANMQASATQGSAIINAATTGLSYYARR